MTALAVQDVSALEEAVAKSLLERGRLDEAGLERARRLRRSTDERLWRILAKLGQASERDLAEALAASCNWRLVSAGDYPDVPILEERLSYRFLKENTAVPIAEDEERLVLAMADPAETFPIDAIGHLSGKRIEPRLGLPSEIDQAIDVLYGKAAQSGKQPESAEHPEAELETDLQRLRDLASEAPVIRLVNRLINQAVERRASDIHIEPFEHAVRVRFRVDGVLQDVEAIAAHQQAAVVCRIKIMAGLNIAERRLPQDGRIRIPVRGAPVDLRVSSVPTVHGEKVVLRVLDREAITLDFKRLGITGPTRDRFVGTLESPHGIFLVTGPTGSGKTTTLYASLVHLKSPEKNIVTVEDPVEFELDGVSQIQVKPRIGLDFANILRSVLRQDPDIILVGEIRDLETARIAVQAALTGHLVLSTLHTNDAASSVTRLLDMGVERYLLTSTLNGVVAQRLVRTLCRQCREPYTPAREVVRQLGLDRYADLEDAQLHCPKGCPACNGTGFHGRTCIVEILPMTEELRSLVIKGVDTGALHGAAVRGGMTTMLDHGMHKALAGITTIDEVLRVTRAV